MWLAGCVLLAAAWYAYDLLFKMPLDEIRTMTNAAKHVADAGAAVSSKTANVASHIAHSVGGSKAQSTASEGSWGQLGAGFRHLGGFIKGLSGGVGSVAQQPIRAVGSAASVSYRGGKRLLKLLLPGAASSGSSASTNTQGWGVSGATADEDTPSTAAVVAARVGAGALLLLLANKAASGGGGGSGSGGAGSSSSKKAAGRPSYESYLFDSSAPQGYASYHPSAVNNSSSSRTAAARARASDVAHSVAAQSATLASALSAAPSWFLSNIKTVAGGRSGGGGG